MSAVTMLHPASDRVQRASRGAFERVWQHEGWILVSEGAEAGLESSGSKIEDAAELPAPRDSKAAWVDWAVHNGADRAEAEAMTKKDLIAAFG